MVVADEKGSKPGSKPREIGGSYFREQNKRIAKIKSWFEAELCDRLNLEVISAPLFLRQSTGLNDNLNGVERPVVFDAKGIEGNLEVVQSLAKWKRHALHRMEFEPGSGILARMTAIRRDEDLSPIHSVLVTQWDWEKVISVEQRNEDFLKAVVKSIYGAIRATDLRYAGHYGREPILPPAIKFLSTSELRELYPSLNPKEREDRICEEHGAVFLTEIGGVLPNCNEPHDGRAADYDDWSLNGDIIVWNSRLKRSYELSSMGIRVDPVSLAAQLRVKGEYEHKKDLPYHSNVLSGKYPLTIGGGIGQCRLALFLVEGDHIGEVHPGVWAEQDQCLTHYM